MSSKAYVDLSDKPNVAPMISGYEVVSAVRIRNQEELQAFVMEKLVHRSKDRDVNRRNAKKSKWNRGVMWEYLHKLPKRLKQQKDKNNRNYFAREIRVSLVNRDLRFRDGDCSDEESVCNDSSSEDSMEMAAIIAASAKPEKEIPMEAPKTEVPVVEKTVDAVTEPAQTPAAVPAAIPTEISTEVTTTWQKAQLQYGIPVLIIIMFALISFMIGRECRNLFFLNAS